MLRAIIFTAAAIGISGAVLAHDYRAGDLVIEHPWARATAPGQPNGAAYMRITNQGETVRVTGVESPIATRAELHTHDMDEAGVMRMRPIDGVDLEPGETSAFAPGGDHIMLMGLESHLVEGERFPLRLVLEKGDTIEIEVQVEGVTYGIDEPASHAHDD